MSTTLTPLPATTERDAVYNRVFWLAYAANVLLVTGNCLTLRFAELVAHLHGTEQIAGMVVSIGMVGALAARFFLGQSIDRYGTRKLWTISTTLFVLGCLGFLGCESVSWNLYAARVAFAAGVAGMFTCSIVHIQNQVPTHRRTEVIGNLGSSGFIGMIVGSQMGDIIYNAIPNGDLRFNTLFGGAAMLGIVYLVLVRLLTRNDQHQRPRETPGAHRLLFRYWPGMLVLIALVMGLGMTVTTVFLTRYATSKELASGVSIFFTTYAIAAFFFRVSLKYWGPHLGHYRMILLGLGGHCLGQFSLILVNQQWQFLIPAIGCGFGHALLFPSVISLGAGRFPPEYRGTGTTIILGFTEFGVVLSAPVLGAVIDHFGFVPMYATAGATCFAIGIAFAMTARPQRHEEPAVERTRQTERIDLDYVLNQCEVSVPSECPAQLRPELPGRQFP